MAHTATDRELAKWRQLGVHRHGNRWRHRIRIAGVRPTESFATPHECLERIAQLEDRRERGDGYAPQADRNRTLGAWAEDVYRLELARRNRRGEPLRENSVRAIAQRWKPWRTGSWAQRPLRLIAAADVAAWHADRHAAAPASANLELRALQRLIRHAQTRGAAVDVAVLLVAPGGHTRRRRRALHTAAQLEHFAAAAPAYARRLILLQGTVGNRISELLTLTADRVQLEPDGTGAIFIPAELCKEGVDKWIDLLPDEVALLREQLEAGPRLVGASSTSHLPPRTANAADLVFPTPSGTRWFDTNYRRQVMAAATAAAAATWPAAWGPSPHPGFTSHDLRATAITLASQARIPEAAVAARVGHKDGGKLVREIYDQTDRRTLAREAFRQLAPAGLRGVDGAPAATHTAAAGARQKGSG